MNIQLPIIKKENNDKKHRINQVIQIVKDAILKKKFNQAWEHVSKYYEQNKSSLLNEQIYQLCWLSCDSITKKVNIRLRTSPKSYKSPITNNYMQHLFSLYLSLHSLIFPEITNKDKQYFDRLSTSQTLINPKIGSHNDLIFQRRSQSFFLQKDQINKELKKLMKQHLKIANNTLMFKVKNKKSIEDVIETTKNVQQIFDSFKQHDFPVEIMNFELVKLSIIEDLGIKQGIQCQYRLPIGLINKIYSHIKNNKEDSLDYYLKKLSSYIVLSFRNLDVSIEDMFIVCQEMLFLTKKINEKAFPSFSTLESKKLALFKINRQITIQQNIGNNKAAKSSSFLTNKASERKVDTKSKIISPQIQLKNIAFLALQKINNYLNSRKEVHHIILTYFNQIVFKNINIDPSDQIIQNEVSLQVSRKNRKSANFSQTSEENPFKKHECKYGRSLTSLLKKKGEKKVAYQDGQEKQTLKANITSKIHAKFIVKNINSIKKQNKKDENVNTKLLNFLKNARQINDIEIIDDSSSDQQGNLRHGFERQRKKQFKNINCLYSINAIEQTTLKIFTMSTQHISQQQTSDNNEEQRIRSISLLDDVVNAVVSDLLKLPDYKQSKERSINSNRYNNPTQCKLQALRMQVQNLNVERQLQVEKLIKRSYSSISQLNSNDSFDKQQDVLYKRQNQMELIAEGFKDKVTRHILANSKLMKLQKQNKFKIKTIQPKVKLTLDKKNRKIPELTFARLQQEYKKIYGLMENKKETWDMFLSCQYDKLRRDVSKNQFASQNEKKNTNKKPKCQTILQKTYEDEEIM